MIDDMDMISEPSQTNDIDSADVASDEMTDGTTDDTTYGMTDDTTYGARNDAAYGMTDDTANDTTYGTPNDTAQTSSADALWPSDTGALSEQSRRALVAVLRGPYLSSQRNPKLWKALRADESAIRSRLNDLFLELVVDDNDEFAFVRKVDAPQIDPPSALRSMNLTFVDTLMLIVLRQMLLAASGQPRVIVGRDDVFDQLAVYNHGDEQTYRRSLNASWKRMSDTLHVLHTLTDDRVEISPVVKFIIDPNRVTALTEKYRRVAANTNPDGRANSLANKFDGLDESDRPHEPSGSDEPDESDEPVEPGRPHKPDNSDELYRQGERHGKDARHHHDERDRPAQQGAQGTLDGLDEQGTVS